jgi:hypothetical protein
MDVLGSMVREIENGFRSLENCERSEEGIDWMNDEVINVENMGPSSSSEFVFVLI